MVEDGSWRSTARSYLQRINQLNQLLLSKKIIEQSKNNSNENCVRQISRVKALKDIVLKLTHGESVWLRQDKTKNCIGIIVTRAQ